MAAMPPPNLAALTQQAKPPMPQQPPGAAQGAPPMGGMPLPMILMFMAGIGFPEFAKTAQKLAGPQAAKGAGAGKAAGVRAEAGQNPGLTIAPLLARIMAMKAQQGNPTASAIPGMM